MSGAEASARFWDGAPCGRGDSFEERSATRFKREPWLSALLSDVAKHDDKSYAKGGPGGCSRSST